jgi:hypothetical protein
MLLACCAMALVATHSWRLSHGVLASLTLSFGLYGALHAAALAASLRAAHAVGRKLLFVALAVCLSMSSVGLSLFANRLMGGAAGLARPALLLALAAGAGAASYLLLIRGFWSARVSPWVFVSIVLGCVAAALLALMSGRLLHESGGPWIAVAWWFAFSAGLCYHSPMLFGCARPPSFVHRNPLR